MVELRVTNELSRPHLALFHKSPQKTERDRTGIDKSAGLKPCLTPAKIEGGRKMPAKFVSFRPKNIQFYINNRARRKMRQSGTYILEEASLKS